MRMHVTHWALLLFALVWAPRAFSTEAADDPPEQQWGLPRSARPDPFPPPPAPVAELTTRLRFGLGLVLGANGIYVPSSNSSGEGTQGAGGVGLSVQLGPQWSELFSTEIEFTGLFWPLLPDVRVAVLAGLTPLDWLSLSMGPALGYAGGTQCGYVLFLIPDCESFGGTYAGGEARIDYFPGVGPPSRLPRTRSSFDLGIVALAGAAFAGAPNGESPLGWGLYLELGFAQF